MKKLIATILILMLTVSCAAAAVVPSLQSLMMDGKPVVCEKYNLNGRNYFKLRDVAALLSGTAVQFSVDWDAETQTISLETGKAYTPNGTELDPNAPDRSATSVYSSQILKINGKTVHWLSVLNIGGNNFFQLRELGEVLNFTVDYDEAENTALITSKAPLRWRITKQTVVRSDSAMTTTIRYTYDEAGNLLETSEANDYADPSRLTTYTYDETGKLLTKQEQTNEGTASTFTLTTFVYDEMGNLLTQTAKMRYVSDPADTVRHTEILSYTYDDSGKFQTWTVTSGSNTFTSRYIYGSSGRLWRIEPIRPDTPISIPMTATTYTYDDSGRLILESIEDDSYGIYSTSYHYEGNRLISSATTGIDRSPEYKDYEYDEYGNEIRCTHTHTSNGYDVTTVTTTEYEKIPS